MIVRVHVTPGARKERFAQTGAHEFAIKVKESAERGEANARIQTLLARHYGVPRTSVRMRSGAHGKTKRYEVI